MTTWWKAFWLFLLIDALLTTLAVYALQFSEFYSSILIGLLLLVGVVQLFTMIFIEQREAKIT